MADLAQQRLKAAGITYIWSFMNLLKTILAVVRLLIFATIAVGMVVYVLLTDLFRLPYRWIFAGFTAATAAIRFVLNIKLRLHGRVPEVQGVIMSNHRSYIDIVLIPSRVPYVIVAKRQVRRWPIVGQAAVAIKTIFVDRDSAESRRRTRESIRNRLAQGISVLIYPEGTTHEGPGILPFKPGMFRTCAGEGFSVIPVAIEFAKKDMAWIGDDTFLRHFIYAFGHWRVDVDVSVGEPLSHADGEVLRQQTEQWVDAETRRLAKRP